MTLNKTWIFGSLTIILLLPFLSEAGEARRHTRRREVRQEKRIHQGVKSGELTKDEAKELQGEQRKIREDRREALKDGKIDSSERKELREEQNKASKDIYEEKHDGEKRP